jgi:hypothetical protein
VNTRIVLAVCSFALGVFACRADSDADRNSSLPRPTAPKTDVKAPGGDVPEVANFSAYLASARVEIDIDAIERRHANAGKVTSIDDRRGVPTFLYATRTPDAQPAAQPEVAARAHVERLRDLYEMPADAVAQARVHRVIDSAGARIVEMRQDKDGLEVYGSRMSLLLDKKNDLVAVSGNLHGGVLEETQPAARASQLPGDKALALAFEDVGGPEKFAMPRPASIKKIYYPMPKELVLAYHVEFEVEPRGSTDSRMFSYVIAADDGGTLERRNLTVSHRYRVWADAAAPFTPMDGPAGDLSPHPSGNPEDDIVLGTVDRNLIDLNGFNKNAQGGSDPWLLPDATETVGNNIDAYADHAPPTGFGEGGVRGKISGPGDFDWAFDGTIQPFENEQQIQSSVAQIFYVTNWLHDHYYDSGFNEIAGNAQKSNYGRGGVENDPLLAEAQDTKGASQNNANMSTPSDGNSPRMQMYLWSGPVTQIGETFFKITAPEALAGTYEAQGSSFGIDDTVTAAGPLVLALDGGGEAGMANDGCEDLVSDVAGKIAVVHRGNCSFIQKAEKAQLAGAAALIIINNTPDTPDELPPVGGMDGEISITIPVLGVSVKTGGILTTPVEAPMTAELSRAGRQRGPFRDGTLDNAIVAHEWGHYFHHRLSNCGGTTMCGGMSEGWGDFVALKMMVRKGDNLDGAYAKAAYSTQSPYFGIRRVPYSVDFAKNALTFHHISDDVLLPTTAPIQGGGPNSEVHNAGEVWATMLFEAYIAMLKESQKTPARMTWEEADRRFSDYMVGGLLLSPRDATYTEMRDAMLAVAAARDPQDLTLLAEAFARRGAGTGAVSPDRGSADLIGVAESYQIGGEVQIVSAELISEVDCDRDGELDGDETAILAVTVRNGGPVALENTRLHADNDTSLTFPNGQQAMIPKLGPFESKTMTLPVKLAEVQGIQAIFLAFRAENDQAIQAEVASSLTRRINYNSRPETSKTDDVESPIVVWNARSAHPEYAWQRVQAHAPNMVWFAPTPASATELMLESPILRVDGRFAIRFEHRFGFESTLDETGALIHWDGGVIELSVDGGKTWLDVTEFGVNPGYGGVLTEEAELPLGGRHALVGMSPNFPLWTTTELNFGTQFAGKDVQIRFHSASDGAVGVHGWELDNLTFEGISNTPFATITADEGGCRLLSGDGIMPDMKKGGGCASTGGDNASFMGIAMMAFLMVARKRRLHVSRPIRPIR